jgi:hypothetical protein
MGNEDYKNVDVYEAEITGNTDAYAAGDLVGSVIQLMDVDDLKPRSGRIISAQIIDLDNQQKNMDLAFFCRSLTAAATVITNNAALSVAGADRKKFIDGCHLTDHISLGATGVSKANNLDIAFRLRSAGDGLFCAPIAREARTQTSVASLLLKLGIIQDNK